MQLLTSNPTFRGLIDYAAAFCALPSWDHSSAHYTPGELLEAIILTESSGRQSARRYEPHQDRVGRVDVRSDPDRAGFDDGVSEDDASYGLMQVMGYTLKGLLHCDRPVRLDYSILYAGIVGLALGIEVFRRCHREAYVLRPEASDAEHVERALCRYNGGPHGDTLDPATNDFRRREYVERVAANAVLVHRDRFVMRP